MNDIPKESGLGWSDASVDDSGGTARDIKNDISNVDFDTPRNVFESPGLDNTSMARILGLGDFSTTIAGQFNDGANLSHDVFKTVCSADVARTITLAISGQTLANEVLLQGYALSRGPDGNFTWSVPAALEDGADPTWT